MEIRKPYTREAVKTEAGGESRTKQSFKKECDINLIMAKYQKTGAITHFNKHQQNYGIADGSTFQDAMNLVCEAQEMFNDLPSSIRSRFGNDPAAFLDFVQNDENADEMARMGLIEQSAEQTDATASAAEVESSEAAETPA
jgi:phage internal scaffolding protein